MKIVFDNYNHDKECTSLWGFSLYVEEHKLLFDTGSNGRVLLANIKKMGIDVSDIKYIFITHTHWDHMGGIDSIIELNSDLTVFLPKSMSRNFVKDLETQVKEVIVCGEKPEKIFDGVYTTGTMKKDRSIEAEQSLILDNEYPVLITGCSHNGIDNVAKVARDALNKDLKAVVGGLHLRIASEKKILDVIDKLKELGVEKTVPTHCAGDLCIELFEKHFGEGYIKGGAGKVFTL
ncbi:MAG: Metal-dependent hydrolases of the beta-lactamase superfamily II [uncultured Campylobacterales bacterium]|uniref:Metal-dependent hydrolases of the beta-lactamase superfamily II n=1 Tax=uncultured Campylobacterales bacterium TaxID=352960 RepID=A0A6S6T1L0_9BACT|nr:MAG: Metal-dependent hydrolases of the beta-lactamase superfamily II [uncultured Campylobacterales bacterium]